MLSFLHNVSGLGSVIAKRMELQGLWRADSLSL
jgi:hypothetical protein